MEYYKDVAKAKMGFSIKYLFMLALGASLIVTTATSIRLIPELSKLGKEIMPEITKVYPSDLEITVKDNVWSINKTEPFNIPMPSAITELFSGSEVKEGAQKFPTNLVVFDTKGTIDDLDKLSTVILINEKNMLTRGSNKLEVYPLKDLPNGTFTSNEYLQFTKGIEKFFGFLPFVIIPCVFVALLFAYFSYRLVYLLVVALVLLIINLFTRTNLKFGELYRIGLHTMTLPLIIDVVSNVIDVGIPVIAWFFIVNVLFGLVVLTTFARSKKAK